jgi:hypothetical protein
MKISGSGASQDGRSEEVKKRIRGRTGEKAAFTSVTWN